ncbi:FxLYD domain-containing protein [Metaclostridioides mangenotii]|uniref:FxLYD domain-containing protein n=1 Tax=Metaclostridioides mangenotii TaxID=1540 RepID=UPI0028E8FAC8|nr:FxLYD domain-containing protein [Clostridioides mangenotii]
MKKKMLGLIMVLSLVLIGVGCNNTGQNNQQSQDTKFIKSIEKATKSRWDYVEKVDKGGISVDSDLEYLQECVKKESGELYKYSDVEFSDAKLKKLAMDYIEGIKIQEESLKYYSSDTMKYDSKWAEGYDLRSVSLLALVDDYGVKVDEKQFEELRTNSQIVEENKALKKSIDEMIKDVKFENTGNDYGWKDYSAVVKNTTDVKFDSFDLEINLLDKDGVVVENQYSNTSNWKPGQSVKFEFSTDKEFEKIEWEYNYFLPE